ncbi:hypothetical protein CC80DRAFT_528710 [Byssothecium circinans]|uniref:CENP-V/GFA domain-containing protein n=1 Tax=Byssothecium circinans TaxID=147558 RepID=A0A6A5TPD1_9PLEO|nr:hypothetical protein CC80DRAFT_528710 [Byssothecium circinans]
MPSNSRPESISGGCLCGAIRFTITFPNEADWPPKSNGICQCTMCRKHSGSLLPQNCRFPISNITPSPPFTPTTHPTYKTYASGPDTERGFCSTCGSCLTFNDKRDEGVIEINLGAFDEDVLCGERDEEKAWEDEYGKHVPRKSEGWGTVLGSPRYHIFCDNEIVGVTDGFDGEKWLGDRESGKSFRGKVRELGRK